MSRSQNRSIAITAVVVSALAIAGAVAVACAGKTVGDESIADGGDAAIGKPCFASSDCADDQFCDSPGWCDGGTCQSIPNGCPGYHDPVCGCNGWYYSNYCIAQVGDKSPVSAIAYGGECRSGAIVPCHSWDSCASNQVCALDPRVPCDGGASCTGFCATADDPATSIVVCSEPGNCGSGTRTCAHAACDSGTWACSYCVYTSGLPCDAGSDCPSGQLCTPPASCNGSDPCPNTCVVP